MLGADQSALSVSAVDHDFVSSFAVTEVVRRPWCRRRVTASPTATCVGGAEDLACGVGGDGVAAFEDAEGVAFLELEAEAVEALAFRIGGGARSERAA